MSLHTIKTSRGVINYFKILHTPYLPIMLIAVLGEGEECRGEGGKGQGKGRGRQRMRAGRFGSEQEALDLNEAVVPCKEGLVCTQVGLDERRCRPEDPAGELQFSTLIIDQHASLISQARPDKSRVKTSQLISLAVGVVGGWGLKGMWG